MSDSHLIFTILFFREEDIVKVLAEAEQMTLSPPELSGSELVCDSCRDAATKGSESGGSKCLGYERA